MMFDSGKSAGTTLSFDAASVSYQGARSYQEDSVLCSFPIGHPLGFSVIADGIGGHVSGHVASALATTEVYSQLKMNEAALTAGSQSIPATLQNAANQANERIAAHTAADDETTGMGSTLLVTVVKGDKLHWLSIGDSPLLLFRGGALRLLNKDHSMAPQIDMMVKMGSMTPEVGRDHPDRNTLVSVVDGNEIAMVDCPTAPLSLLPDDIIIAASDGLQYLPNATLANVLMLSKDGRSADIANALLGALQQLDHPEQDNTAFCVIKFGDMRQAPNELHAEDIPVLAVADSVETPQAPAAATAPDPAAAEAEREKKAYWYRGQKYYKD
ncbi:protein phosphatase 2C domain-containing protein [Yoonia sp. BS5-3]|uniref:PP2C family serine/threonine-protein phosphatase n=1 Tax=Yoonia phaeophyticola TaxID=3137369 RepID=A0ABZ2VC05_9RHOB